MGGSPAEDTTVLLWLFSFCSFFGLHLFLSSAPVTPDEGLGWLRDLKKENSSQLLNTVIFRGYGI